LPVYRPRSVKELRGFEKVRGDWHEWSTRRKNAFGSLPRLFENGVEKEMLDTGCRN
jgi:hypothetical protein